MTRLKRMKKNLYLLLPMFVISLTAIIVALDFIFENIPHKLVFVARWLSILSLIPYCIKKRSLTSWILLSIVIGATMGYDYPNLAKSLHPLSQGFIKLVKTIVGPILFATLVYGIAGHSDLKQVGRMAWKSLSYFYFASTVALFIGLAAINITQAGKGIDMSQIPHEDLPQTTVVSTDAPLLEDLPENVHWLFKTLAFFRDIFPENIIKSIYENQVLQIVVFSVVFGIGLAMVEEKKRKPLVDFTESLSEAMFKFTNVIMYFAPFGVGAAMAYTVGRS